MMLAPRGQRGHQPWRAAQNPRTIGDERMTQAGIRYLVLLTAAAAVTLSGCDAVKKRLPGNPVEDAPAGQTADSPPETTDIEAPGIYQTTDRALWDGRPSLGGTWVAAPDVKDPERVVMKNPGNGRSVVGALFRRERDNPGPKLQLSSDAASALGLLAGQPATITVIALRRGEAQAEPGAASPAVRPKPSPRTATAGARGLIQVGSFGSEANARKAADRLSGAGIPARVRKPSGGAVWSVVAEPPEGAKAGLSRVRDLGFTDAYPIAS